MIFATIQTSHEILYPKKKKIQLDNLIEKIIPNHFRSITEIPSNKINSLKEKAILKYKYVFAKVFYF